MSPEIVPFVQAYHMYFFFCILHFIFLYFCGWLLIHPPVMSPEMAAFVRAWKRGLASHGGNCPHPKAGSSRIWVFLRFSDICLDKEIAHMKADFSLFSRFPATFGGFISMIPLLFLSPTVVTTNHLKLISCNRDIVLGRGFPLWDFKTKVISDKMYLHLAFPDIQMAPMAMSEDVDGSDGWVPRCFDILKAVPTHQWLDKSHREVFGWIARWCTCSREFPHWTYTIENNQRLWG